MVEEGQKIAPGDVLAESQVRSQKTVNLAKILKVKPPKVKGLLLKKLGQEVTSGEIIAQKKSLLGKRKFIAPLVGRLESLENDTGILTLSCPDETISLVSPVEGTVKEIREGKEIVIEFSGWEIEVQKGVGPKRQGEIFTGLAKKEKIDLWDLDYNLKDKVVLGKNWPGLCLAKAKGLQISAILAQEIQDEDWENFAQSKAPLALLILGKSDFEKVQKFAGCQAIFEPQEKKLIIFEEK